MLVTVNVDISLRSSSAIRSAAPAAAELPALDRPPPASPLSPRSVATHRFLAPLIRSRRRVVSLDEIVRDGTHTL